MPGIACVPLTRLLHSTGFRTGLGYAALFGVSALILFSVVYWQTVGDMERQLRAAIDGDVQSLMADYHNGGHQALRQAVADRLATARSNTEGWYLLLDSHGTVLAGNLPPLPRDPGWAEVQAPGGGAGTDTSEPGEGHAVYGRGLRLADGSFLFVGQDAHPLEEMRELMVAALSWGLGVTLLLAALGGAVMGAGALRRVEVINRVAGEIVHGDLARRIPVRGSGDEFDILAEHLNYMLARIQHLMEGMRQVTSDIAHDLRTPLGRVRQRLEAARREATTLVEYQNAVDQAIQETDQIIATFAALLSIAQIESGSRRARFADVDLTTALDTVLDAYAPVAEESGHTLHAELATGIHIHGDRDLLVQAFANLIENALHHTPSGGRIEVSLTAMGNGCIVTVADNGPGIPAEARDKVTQRFYRLEASRSTPGSGLGLSLVAAIADLHDAKLELSDNQPGLRVTLRLVQDQR